jgi:hypothetical protein
MTEHELRRKIERALFDYFSTRGVIITEYDTQRGTPCDIAERGIEFPEIGACITFGELANVILETELS